MTDNNVSPNPQVAASIRCFACDKKLKSTLLVVTTRDGQSVYVGPECFRHICGGREEGYQPPLGGSRLYQMSKEAFSKRCEFFGCPCREPKGPDCITGVI